MGIYIFFIALAIILGILGIGYICVGKNRLGIVLLVITIIIVKIICNALVWIKNLVKQKMI